MVYFAFFAYTMTAMPTTALITLNDLRPFLPTLAPQIPVAPASLWVYVGIHSPPCCSTQLKIPHYNATQPVCQSLVFRIPPDEWAAGTFDAARLERHYLTSPDTSSDCVLEPGNSEVLSLLMYSLHSSIAF